VKNLPPNVSQRFARAYGGKATQTGWRAEQEDAAYFARNVLYFCPDKATELGILVDGVRRIGATKPVRTRAGFRQLPISAKEIAKRRAVESQLVRAQQQSGNSELPPKFHRDDPERASITP